MTVVRDVGVVIVAGGSGTRAAASGAELKQFRWVAGKPTLLHSLQTFMARPDVVSVVVRAAARLRRRSAAVDLPVRRRSPDDRARRTHAHGVGRQWSRRSSRRGERRARSRRGSSARRRRYDRSRRERGAARDTGDRRAAGCRHAQGGRRDTDASRARSSETDCGARRRRRDFRAR